MDYFGLGAQWAATSDSGEVHAFLTGNGVRCHFIAAPGAFEAAHLASLPPHMVVGQFDATGPLEFVLPGRVDHLVIIAACSGVLALSQANGIDYEVAGQGVLMVDCRFPLDTHVVVSGSFHMASLDVQSFERRLAERTVRKADGALSYETPVMTATCSDLAIHSLLQGFVQCARDALRINLLQEALISMQRAIIDMCLCAFPSNQLVVLEEINDCTILPKHVRRAVQYMRQNAHSIEAIEEVAQAAMTSRRSLETGFKRFLQVTPAKYLRQLRLERARADLLDPVQVCSVSTIACRWGFLHLGLFSRYYRHAYGELPSETLARRP